MKKETIFIITLCLIFILLLSSIQIQNRIKEFGSIITGYAGGSDILSGVYCGDGNCDLNENCEICQDCACQNGYNCLNEECIFIAGYIGVCGDGTCSEEETRISCCEDCGCSANRECVDGICIPGPPSIEWCADGYCNGEENCGTCPYDCGCPEGSLCILNECKEFPSTCFNNICNSGENCKNCPWDCGCGYGELCIIDTCLNIPETCSNNVCDIGEGCGLCPQDCKCDYGYACVENTCQLISSSEIKLSPLTIKSLTKAKELSNALKNPESATILNSFKLTNTEKTILEEYAEAYIKEISQKTEHTLTRKKTTTIPEEVKLSIPNQRIEVQLGVKDTYPFINLNFNS